MRYRSATVTGFHGFSRCLERDVSGVKRTSNGAQVCGGAGKWQGIFHAWRCTGYGCGPSSFVLTWMNRARKRYLKTKKAQIQL